MAQTPDASVVEESEDFLHVRFRDPDKFDTIRTPDWAANAAGSVEEGAEVRTGKREDSDDWLVQSVLIPNDADEQAARDNAEEIVAKIES
jgi:hypothetical protein